MPYLSSQVFLGLVLEFLISYTPSASSLKQCSNKANGQNCRFNHRQNILWCDSTTFTSLPPPNEIHGEGDPRYAQTIYLNSSCQQHFTGVLRQYAHVKQLNYVDNMIQNIPASCFSHLHLEELVLSRNSISTINGTFNGLSNLTILRLNRNNLKFVHRHAFKELISLKILDLSYNKIKKFEPGHLSGLIRLRELRLGHNRLQSIDSDLLVSSPHLEVVDLSSNRLQSLPANLFDNQSDLRSVLLMSNQLRTPHPVWFRSIVANGRMPDVNLMQNNKWLCDCHSIRYRDFLKLEHLWIDKLDVRCFQPATNKGKYLSDVKDIGSNCPLPLECEQQQSSTKTTNVPRPTTTEKSTTTKSTTTKSTTTKSTTTESTVPIAKINSRRRVTTTTTTTTTFQHSETSAGVPKLSNQVAEPQENQFMIISIVMGSICIVLIVVAGVAVYCCMKKLKKVKVEKQSTLNNGNIVDVNNRNHPPIRDSRTNSISQTMVKGVYEPAPTTTSKKHQHFNAIQQRNNIVQQRKHDSGFGTWDEDKLVPQFSTNDTPQNMIRETQDQRSILDGDDQNNSTNVYEVVRNV
ncbi:uncharacterized protein LOC100181234 [Ciona intestinalis]